MSSNYADTLNLYTELCVNYISIKQKKKVKPKVVPTFGAQGSSPGKGPGRWEPVRSQALVHSSSPARRPAAKVTREEGRSTAPDAGTAERPLSSFAEAACLSFVPGSLAAPLSSGEGATHPGSHLSAGQSPGCSLALICALSANARPVCPLLMVPEPLQPPCVRVQCWPRGALGLLLGWAPGSLGSQPSARL